MGPVQQKISFYGGFFYFLTLFLESSGIIEDNLNCNVHLRYPLFFLKKADVYDGYKVRTWHMNIKLLYCSTKETAHTENTALTQAISLEKEKGRKKIAFILLVIMVNLEDTGILCR